MILKEGESSSLEPFSSTLCLAGIRLAGAGWGYSSRSWNDWHGRSRTRCETEAGIGRKEWRIVDCLGSQRCGRMSNSCLEALEFCRVFGKALWRARLRAVVGSFKPEPTAGVTGFRVFLLQYEVCASGAAIGARGHAAVFETPSS